MLQRIGKNLRRHQDDEKHDKQQGKGGHGAEGGVVKAGNYTQLGEVLLLAEGRYHGGSYRGLCCECNDLRFRREPWGDILKQPNAGPDAAVVDISGFLKGARFIPSPNFDERPPELPITLLVVHAISLPPQQFGGDEVIEFFTNRLDPAAHPFFDTIRDLRVSAHFYIRRDGEILQFVSCNLRAWHAGQSEWKGRDRCNDFSIGIELEGSDYVPFEDAQYAALAKLSNAIRRVYPIADVVGHADIAPGRKTDPGPFFDWPRFRAMLD